MSDAEVDAVVGGQSRELTNRGLVVRLAVLGVLSLVALPYVVAASVPDLRLGLPGESAVAGPLRAAAGQRWGFFSADPLEAVLTAFVLRDGEWSPVVERTVDGQSRSLGFGRYERTMADELERLVDEAEEQEMGFVACGDRPTACAERLRSVAVVNQAARGRACGEVLVRRAAPAHWQLSAGPERDGLDGSYLGPDGRAVVPEYLRLRVRC